MPQPIRRKCHFELNGLINRPEHAAVIGQIVGISGRLESMLGWLLALFSRGSAAITVPMFSAVASTDAQRSMLLVAAEQALGHAELEAFKELMDDFRPRYNERNKVVHNLWGYSDDYPDKALWCKASDAAAIMAEMASLSDPGKIDDVSDLITRCMSYSVQDLTDIANRLHEYTTRVTAFLREMIHAHPALAVVASAATNAPPMSEEPQLDLRNPDQTDPQSNQPKG